MSQKIDLSLLKRFVAELENGLDTAEALRASEGDVKEYLVELSKSSGLAASVMQEASMLVGDIQRTMMKLQNPSSGGSDLLAKLLGGAPGGSGPMGGSFGGFGGGDAN